MLAEKLLQAHLADSCPEIHSTRLQSVLDVASGLYKSKNLSLTGMARHLNSETDNKHKIKKVDRLEGNAHLHKELAALYSSLSGYVFKYLSQNTSIPIIVDLCFMKDCHEVQMLSAEVAVKGRSIPVYREVFKAGELKNRAEFFLSNLAKCIPSERDILLIMDAGFSEAWLKAIEALNWNWLIRIRAGKQLKIRADRAWQSVKDISPEIGSRTKIYNDAFIMKKYERPCRIVTIRKQLKKSRKKSAKSLRNDKAGTDSYRRSAKEPWILATNLPLEYKAKMVVDYYSKRMQIEESFRDIKSHQFGLGARYVRTNCVHRWAVKMLLTAIVQIIYWIIGVIGHSQGFQRKFQANTVRDKKIFSYFYLGKLLIEFDKVKELSIDYENLPAVIEQELAREW